MALQVLHEACSQVAFFLCVFESTGEVESAFSVLAKFNALNETNQNNYMKVYTDAGPIDNIVRLDLQSGKYFPSELCIRVFQSYRLAHGGKAKNTKKHGLPRLKHQKRLRKTGMAAFKRQREQEKRDIAAPESVPAQEEPDAAVEHLAEAASSSATSRKSKKQVDLREALKHNIADRMLKFRHGRDHSWSSRLQQHEAKALQDIETLRRLENRSLQQQAQSLRETSGVVYVVLGNEVRENDKIKKSLGRMHQLPKGRIYGRTHFLNELHDRTFFEKNPDAKNFFWLCVDADTFRKVLHPEALPSLDEENPDETALKDISVAFASRILGGYVASPSWLEVAAKSESPVPAPILELHPASASQHQLYLTKKVPSRLVELFGHLQFFLTASLPERVQWVLREKKTYLILGCNVSLVIENYQESLRAAAFHLALLSSHVTYR